METQMIDIKELLERNEQLEKENHKLRQDKDIDNQLIMDLGRRIIEKDNKNALLERGLMEANAKIEMLESERG